MPFFFKWNAGVSVILREKRPKAGGVVTDFAGNVKEMQCLVELGVSICVDAISF